MTHDKMIAVIQAHKERKEVEVKSKINGKWTSMKAVSLSFNFNDFDYRIKPSYPREIWVNVLPDGFGIASLNKEYCEQSEAVSKHGSAPVKYILAEDQS